MKSAATSCWVALLVLAPELARACAVCGSAVDEDQSRLAYIATTIVLSALPLALFGGVLLYLRSKSRRQRSAQGQPHPN